MPNSIDRAHNGPTKMAASILGLAYKVNEYIHANSESMTDAYRDVIANAHLHMDSTDGVSSLTDYKEYVLNMTFAYAGRKHYDDLKKIADTYITKLIR